MFLFHTGSIKRRVLSRRQWVVRCFYSILVRLKAAAVFAERASREFLFHTGSIKSVSSTELGASTACFYSILVRLKEKRNSHFKICLQKSFYSILVRLKVPTPMAVSQVIPRFLFHTGSIKRQPSNKVTKS